MGFEILDWFEDVLMWSRSGGEIREGVQVTCTCSKITDVGYVERYWLKR